MAGKAEAAVAQWALQHQMIPEDLDLLANRIRMAYVEERQTTFPSYHLHTVKYNQTFWRKVATHIIDIKADPAIYVNLAFRQFGPRTYPEALLSLHMRDVYDNAFLDRAVMLEARTSLNSYQELLRQRFNEHTRSLEALLADRTICSFSLFIWCIAKKFKLEAIAQAHEPAAQRTLLRPAYKEVYMQEFPEVFNGSS